MLQMARFVSLMSYEDRRFCERQENKALDLAGTGIEWSAYIVLTFLLYDPARVIEQEVDDAIASIELQKLPQPIPACPAVMEWFASR